MSDAGSVIEKKVRAFAKDINKFLDGKRAAKAATLKKKAPETDVDKALVSVSFAYSGAKGSISRSPQQQAEAVSQRTSWTCAGAHMTDNARHVAMTLAAPGKRGKVSWDVDGAFGGKDQHFLSLGELKTKWKSVMAAHGLKNHKGGDGWGEGDPFHFELPDSKIPHSDKRVQACMLHYAKITRVEGKQRNPAFENDKNWKGDLKPHLAAAEKEAAKIAEDKRKAEMKKLQFDGSTSGSQSLMRGVNRSGAAAGKALAAIDVVGPWDTGGRKTRRVTANGGFTWDSLARSIFEKLGLAETSGFDVKLSCSISYDCVTYDNLSQSFIENLTPACMVTFNTPAAKAMGMTVAAKADIKLAKSAKAPAGTVIFEFELKTPIDKEKGTVTFTLDGAKATAKARLN